MLGWDRVYQPRLQVEQSRSERAPSAWKSSRGSGLGSILGCSWCHGMSPHRLQDELMALKMYYEERLGHEGTSLSAG